MLKNEMKEWLRDVNYMHRIEFQLKPGAPQGAALYYCRSRTLNVGASMDTTFKLETALNLDCHQVFDIIWVSDTKQMSRSYKFIAQIKISSFNFPKIWNLRNLKKKNENYYHLPFFCNKSKTWHFFIHNIQVV